MDRAVSENALFTRLIDLRPSTSHVNAMFIVLEKGKVDRMRDVHSTPICFALVAWGAEVENFHAGDIIRLTNGYFTLHKQSLFLKAGRRGNLERVGEFCMLFTETPNLSRVQWVSDPNTKQMAPVLEPVMGPQH
eukprot:CAMPEP_0114326578 /NCGR_PEP_ID=MMETSP0059-20121206/29796_1 /TAXON_ID=36894 /ORGANISM="Pyramimonas parkeae, Strain CCMP726" /LENGTH=133 /DNA_ID=CAMNT_0001455555 /DNA_START=155 /DNA_END=556 /DNA_ORIENTATION=-